VLSSASQKSVSSHFPTPHDRIPFLNPPQLMVRGGSAWDGPSCGARAFLSQSVTAVLYGETEADSHHNSFSYFQHHEVVLEDGTFNFQLLSAPVPPPKDVGLEHGIYADAAKYLRHIAKACSHFFSSPMAREKLGVQKLSELVQGSCHARALQQIVLITLERYGGTLKREELRVLVETEVDEEEAKVTAAEVAEQQRVIAPLLACCIIERSLFDLYHHMQSMQARERERSERERTGDTARGA
jgi:hypothetical protein